MHRFLLPFLLFCASFLGAAGALAQAEPSELFLNAYMAVQQADKLERDGDASAALQKLRYAASVLDQIAERHPEWQPLIVDYRRKKTGEQIRKLQGDQPAAESTPTWSPPEDPLPGASAEAPDVSVSPPALRTDGTPASDDLKRRLAELEKELKTSRQRMAEAEKEKEKLAGRLGETLKQLDETKSGSRRLETELEAAKASAKATPEIAEMRSKVEKLQQTLDAAQAERDAADAVFDQLNRRYAKSAQSVESITRERDAALKKSGDLETKIAEASKVAEELRLTKSEIEKMKSGQAEITESGKQVAADLEKARAQLAALEKEREAAKKHSADLDAQLASAKQEAKQSAAQRDAAVADREKMLAERDKAVSQRDTVAKQRDDLEKKTGELSAERDRLARERDGALAEIAKLREAKDRVDKLLAENQSLAAKLGDAEKTIAAFKTDAPGKETEILRLRGQVAEVRAQLEAVQRENEQGKGDVAELRKKLEESEKNLAEAKSAAAGSPDAKRAVEENTLLRGIVLREMKQQARREQARQVVLDELQKLEVKSGAILSQLDYLGAPVFKLSEEERKLFKTSELELIEAESPMEITLAAPKISGEVQQPTSTPSAASPSGPVGDELPVKESAAAPAGPAVEAGFTPNLPEDLLPLAREAKGHFEKGEYREAELVYDKILARAPNNVYALSNMGVVRFRSGKLKLAEEALRKAVEVAPGDAFSFCTLGIVYYQQGKLDEAVDVLTKALSINPKYAVAHNYLGITASQKGWQEAAFKELETAIAIDPSYADAHFNLAVVHAMQEPPNKEAARKFYKKALALGAEADSALEDLIKN